MTMALAMRRGTGQDIDQSTMVQRMIGQSMIGQSMGQERAHPAPPTPRKQLIASSLAQFVDPLPLPEIIQPRGRRPSPENPALQLPYYRVAMREFETKVHRDLKPTRMWGYESSCPGPIFETRSGQGLLVEWANELPAKHFLPVDHNIHGAEADKPEVRAVVHLHGAKAGPKSDGYPENWYVPGKSAVYHYPNQQDAAMLWYHDHALGINRLNIFAGLLGAYFVRDAVEDAVDLPRGKFEIPLVIYDRLFDLDGQLNYPISGDPKAPWVPEVLGDAILVNGKLFPYLEVEPRQYRFRALNGSNGRSIHLTFISSRATPWFPKFYQIGSDQGLLAAPVEVVRVRLMPAERADLIFDFSDHAGTSIFLRNDNYNVMEFRVAARGTAKVAARTAAANAPNSDGGSALPRALPPKLRPVPKIAESDAVKTRVLSLVEIDDANRRTLMTLLNNAHWNTPVTENPVLDSVEIWNFVNLTNDDHPIHLHLVRFQVLDRRAFDTTTFRTTGELKYIGPARPPDAGETGWKDTVRADHGMATRIIVRFEGFAGRYVWHCHILEHEDNEMMRPFDVVPR
jgi:spore coat protein A, manganese oxidase